MKEYHTSLHNAVIKGDGFIHKTFSNVYVDGPALSSEELNIHPTMLACTHRSHMDYILLGMSFHKLGLNNLRYAAGDNLTNMPYIGRKFRSWGAFTVYRAHSHRRSYIFELTQQVVDMLNNQDNIIVFPEGGRSYNGSMMPIKSGILAANILAQYNMPQKQYVYLPVAISYERLPELRYFTILQKGKELRNNKKGILAGIKGDIFYFGSDLFAFAKLILAHRFGKNYGDVYIDYAKPIAVNDIVDINANYSSKSRNEFFAHKVSIQKVGEVIREQLMRLYRIFPMYVIAEIVKKSGACTRSEVAQKVPALISALKKNNRNCKSLCSMSDKEIVEKGILQLRYSKAISVKGNTLKPKNIKMLNYYAASIEWM